MRTFFPAARSRFRPAIPWPEAGPPEKKKPSVRLGKNTSRVNALHPPVPILKRKTITFPKTPPESNKFRLEPGRQQERPDNWYGTDPIPFFAFGIPTAATAISVPGEGFRAGPNLSPLPHAARWLRREPRTIEYRSYLFGKAPCTAREAKSSAAHPTADRTDDYVPTKYSPVIPPKIGNHRGGPSLAVSTSTETTPAGKACRNPTGIVPTIPSSGKVGSTQPDLTASPAGQNVGNSAGNPFISGFWSGKAHTHCIFRETSFAEFPKNWAGLFPTRPAFVRQKRAGMPAFRTERASTGSSPGNFRSDPKMRYLKEICHVKSKIPGAADLFRPLDCRNVGDCWHSSRKNSTGHRRRLPERILFPFRFPLPVRNAGIFARCQKSFAASSGKSLCGSYLFPCAKGTSRSTA